LSGEVTYKILKAACFLARKETL